MNKTAFTWYEFFAGGGMSRLGLGEHWRCVFANEWCEKKAAAYRCNFGACDELKVKDVAELSTADLPGQADLAWASFPCQDLSLAGSGAGLNGERSGMFRPFWNLIDSLVQEKRAPHIVVLENVIGALTSHGGKDFTCIVNSFARTGYRVGCLVIDAVRFVPQSRPRLFVIGVSDSLSIPDTFTSNVPSEPWHPGSLRAARERLPRCLDDAWIWWSLPVPDVPAPPLTAIIEEEPIGIAWHTTVETTYLLSLMSPLHRRKVEAAKEIGIKLVGAVYRRTRPDDQGKKVQRAEVRFDNIAGCLRTPVGGSSRQTIIVVEGDRIRSRLLSPRG